MTSFTCTTWSLITFKQNCSIITTNFNISGSCILGFVLPQPQSLFLLLSDKKKVQNIIQIPALPWGEICPYMLWSPSSGFPQLFLSLDQLTLTLFSSTSHCILSAISSCTAGITTAFFGLAAWWGRQSGLSLRSYLLCKAHALHFTSKSHQKSELSTHTHKKSDKGKRSHHTWNSIWTEGNYTDKRGKYWTLHQRILYTFGTLPCLPPHHI